MTCRSPVSKIWFLVAGCLLIAGLLFTGLGLTYPFCSEYVDDRNKIFNRFSEGNYTVVVFGGA